MDPADPAFQSLIDRRIEDARGAGASARQIEVLLEIRDTGEVTYDQVAQALSATRACLEENGLQYTALPDDDHYGMAIPAYEWSAPISPSGGITHEQLLAIGDNCVVANSAFVEAAYQIQPVAVQLEDEWYDRVIRDPMYACLLDNGAPVEEGMTFSELLRVDADYFGADNLVRGEWAQGVDFYENCFIAAMVATGN